MRRWLLSWLAFVLVAQLSFPARAVLVQSKVLENNVAYLRVSEAGKNLADEISAAEVTLAISNKTAGIILDLRFANGDDADAAKAAANLLAAKKSPLAILVNGETSGAAEKLAQALRDEHAGLIFGSATADLQPDIAVTVSPADEKIFLKDPYALLTTNNATVTGTTNDFVPFIDHTSEADLVRQKVKDGDEDEAATSRPLPPTPVIRDPALARAVDFLKALTILQPTRG